VTDCDFMRFVVVEANETELLFRNLTKLSPERTSNSEKRKKKGKKKEGKEKRSQRRMSRKRNEEISTKRIKGE